MNINMMTHNAGGVDGEDWETACMMIGESESAGIIITTAADQVGGHPARAEERHTTV